MKKAFTQRNIGLLQIVFLLILSMVLGLSFGAVPIPIKTVFNWVIGNVVSPQESLILGSVRLPRLLVGVLCGASLAVTGAVMQIWTANPLAGPGLLGLNGGVSAALALTISFCPWIGSGQLILVSLFGATGGGILVLVALKIIPASSHPLRLVLIGAMVSAFLASITASLIIANGMQADLLFWLVGGLGTVGWRDGIYISVAMAISFIILIFIINDLASVSLGDSVARSLGVNTKKFRLLVSLLVVLLAGTSNAIAGPIGFIGFLSPHLARRVVGPSPRPLLPLAAIIGAVLVVCADAFGRILTAPEDQPLGLFVALIGAPALVFVALRYERRV
jgi:ABC-type Fe3+-siderophore transport system permease subunit